MIEIQNLTRNYGSLVAVDDVSIQIQRGEIVGLLGHNGAGKTTVMKVLTGFLEPSSGTVTVGGLDVTIERDAVQRQIGYLPENAPLYPEMLVQEYLQMMAELRGILPAERDAAVCEAARSTGLEEHLVRPIGELSKGYRQRVGIAQAILHQPPVLVLDEPTNGLDPVQIQSIRELILRLSENTTIILSTHILQEIEAVCDRVLVMIQGALVADDSLAGLVGSDRVALSLRGTPADVAAALAPIPGIDSVDAAGSDPNDSDCQLYSILCSAQTRPIPEIIEACRERGWTITSVAPQHVTLESVFESLQKEHIVVQKAGKQDHPDAAGTEAS